MKLVCCDLWTETLVSFGITHPYRLASATEKGAKSILRRRDGLTETTKEATLQRIATMARTVTVIPEDLFVSGNSDLFNQMISVGNIDSGEAQLALVTMHSRFESRLVTGDKRFIQAMAEHFPEEFAKLHPMIVTFEDCLTAICTNQGLDNIRSRLIAARGCDGTLHLALGHNGDATQEQFLEVLKSYQVAPKGLV